MSSTSRWAAAERRVEEYLLGGTRRYTREDMRERSELPFDTTTRLWNALGFSTGDEGVPLFADADVEALATMGRLLEADDLVQREALAIARTVGQSMARLAEWQADELRALVLERGTGDDPAVVVDAVESLVPLMERLQNYAWRRHLVNTTARAMSGLAHAEETDARDVMVAGFADIVGYTAMSRQVGDTELRDLLERFEARTSEIVARHGGRLVKTIGDEVLFVVTDPVAALGLARALQDEVPDDEGRLQLRVGMAFGQLLPRYGDVYGPVVNIAARLTSHARPGTILVDDELTRALRDAGAECELRSVPPLAVRGYRHLHPHVVRRSGSDVASGR